MDLAPLFLVALIDIDVIFLFSYVLDSTEHEHIVLVVDDRKTSSWLNEEKSTSGVSLL